MGWKSTMELTREEAERAVVERFARLGEWSDEVLAAVLEELTESAGDEWRGYNFVVVRPGGGGG